MAERLTDKVLLKKLVNGYYGDIDVYQKSYIKLGMLEDIMEKYHCNDIEELEKKLADSDTWQKACELACDVLRDINYKIYNEDRIDFENSFYQQAKKEGNDE